MKNVIRNTIGLLLASQTAAYAYTSKREINWNDQVLQPLKNALVDAVSFIPDIVFAVLILVSGWLIAKIVQFVISRFLLSIKFDNFAQKMGITELLGEGKEPIAPHRWIGNLSFWVVIVISIISSLNQLQLRLASARLDGLLHFLSTIFSTVVIFIIGMFLSFIAAKLIRVIAQNLKMQKPELFANLTKWTVLVFTAMVCLMEIGLPPQIVLIAITIVFVTLCITFVIAFGTGGIGWASKVLDRTLEKKN
ncbi:MAG: hypothetical protein GY853_00245 [PVC group bacterium]|nr:hypothetical protein [PVC group bacterium]